jgi:hypothetical protein
MLHNKRKIPEVDLVCPPEINPLRAASAVIRLSTHIGRTASCSGNASIFANIPDLAGADPVPQLHCIGPGESFPECRHQRTDS